MNQPDNQTPTGTPLPPVEPTPPPSPETDAGGAAPAVPPAPAARRPVSAQEFRDVLTGREATMPIVPGAPALSGREPTMQAMPPSLSGREPTMQSMPPSLSGREPTMQAMPPSLSGREPTMQVMPDGLTGREPTMPVASAVPGLTGREPTMATPAAPGLTGREMTMQELPASVTGRERTLTDTPATMAAGGKPPTDPASKPPTDPARRTPTDMANTTARKPMTLGAGRSQTGSGTSANFDDAWHLQGRKGPFTGQTWEDFDLGGILGEGGMGAVYRAKQRSLYRRVAIKVLPPNLAADSRLLERFMLEARTASTMQSPHIVQVYAIGEHDGNHYFAMEFVEGTDLYEVMKARKEAGTPLTADEAADYIMQAAKGLAEAGRHGIVHRDIKPPNLMVTRKDNLVKIADFGIVKVMGEHNLTMTGQAVGTPAYVSPEQGRGDREIDQRSDLYSLGVVFYELLCGKKPFEGTTPSALIYQHCYDEPELPQKINPGITNEYQAVVLKCLQKKPENRYQSADDLITDLQAIKTGAMLKSALANYKGTGADEARREQMNWIQRNLLKVAIAAGVVVLGGGGAAYWYLGTQQEAALAIDQERRQLETLNTPSPLPDGVEGSLDRFEKLVGSDDQQLQGWRRKVNRVRELEGRLAPIDQEVTAALRTSSPKLLDELRSLVKDAPNVVRWGKALDDATVEDQRLRGRLRILDTQALTSTSRDPLRKDLESLQRLAPAGDPQVKGWATVIDEFDVTMKKLLGQLAPLDQMTGNIPQDRIAAFSTALDLIKPKVGEGDPRYVAWRDKLDKARGYVGDLRQDIRQNMGDRLMTPRPVQDRVAANLKILEDLAGAEDGDVQRWKNAIRAANDNIAAWRKQLTDAFAPLAADDILPVGQHKPMADCLKRLEELEQPGDLAVIRWNERIQKSIKEAQDLDDSLKRLEPTDARPIPLADQQVLAGVLVRLKDKGGVDLKREQECRARLDAEQQRVAALRRRLAEALDAPLPFTDTVRQDLDRLATDAGGTDADVVKWRAKQARITALEGKLAPLADDQQVVPPGCQELFAHLLAEVGSDDARVVRFTPRFKQVQQVEAALAAVDKAVPLPAEVTANLERYARLFGPKDPVYVRRAAKVARVAALKERLLHLDAVVAEPATTLADDRAAFAELMTLVGPTDSDVPTVARRLAQLMGPGRPAWASASGRDEYGLWADLVIRDQKLRFRFCPPGRVVLGSPDGEAGREPDEVPVPVVISKGVWMAESECPQVLWTRLMAANPSRLMGDNRPVERVSYADVQRFLALFKQAVSACPVRLPTEAEWEYACRAGSAAPWSAVKAEDAVAEKVAWFAGNAQAASHEIKLRFPNALGLYDLHGNVWEWCEDRFGAYPTSAITDWIGRDGQLRVVRGGSWGDPDLATRAANRQGAKDDLRSAYVGFRLAVDVQWPAVPDGATLLAGAPSNRKRVEVPLGDGKLAIEVMWPETETQGPAKP